MFLDLLGEFRNVKLGFGVAEQRPAIVAKDVDGLVFDALAAQKPSGSVLELHSIMNLTIRNSTPMEDVALPSVEAASY